MYSALDKSNSKAKTQLNNLNLTESPSTSETKAKIQLNKLTSRKIKKSFQNYQHNTNIEAIRKTKFFGLDLANDLREQDENDINNATKTISHFTLANRKYLKSLYKDKIESNPSEPMSIECRDSAKIFHNKTLSRSLWGKDTIKIKNMKKKLNILKISSSKIEENKNQILDSKWIQLDKRDNELFSNPLNPIPKKYVLNYAK